MANGDNKKEKKPLPPPEACFDIVPQKRGRPKKILNQTGVAVVEALSSRFCSQEEVATYLDVDFNTLHNESNEPIFSSAYKKGFENGKSTLRSYQFALARTNATMAIFLGKNYLGQSDEPDRDKTEFEDLKPLADLLKEDDE